MSFQSKSHPKRKRVPHPLTPPEVNHFPASCQHMFGPLPIPPTDTIDYSVSENTFPHNISFRRADWVNEHIPEDRTGYDVIIA